MKFITNMKMDNSWTKESLYSWYLNHKSIFQKILFVMRLKKLVLGKPRIGATGYDYSKLCGVYEKWVF